MLHNYLHNLCINRYGSKMTELLESFRSIGHASNGAEGKLDHLLNISLPAVSFLINDKKSSALDRTRYFEALSYGDPNVLLASPGPSLSGIFLRLIGMRDHVEVFYESIKKNAATTFFALTESECGGNISQMQTTATKTKGGYIISGGKCFIGNGCIAKHGIIFARSSHNKLEILPFLVLPDFFDDSSIKTERLDVSALKGAKLSAMQFDQLFLPDESLLINENNRIPFLSIWKCFNAYRCGLVSMYLGQVQACLDIVGCQLGLNINISLIMKKLQKKVDMVRLSLHALAEESECNFLNPVPGCVSKTVLLNQLNAIMHELYQVIPVTLYINNDYLFRAYRDQFCWRYMEGTEYVQNKIIFSQMNQFKFN